MKNTKVVLIIIGLLVSSVALAGWFRTFGSTGQDEKGYCVQVTNDSNYIVSGYKGNELWLFKTDTLGSILWERTYPGRVGSWVEQTDEGGYIVAGGYKLLKTDSEGDTLWIRDMEIYSRCVQQTTDGGFIVTGGIGSSFPYYLALFKTNSTGDSSWLRTYNLTGWVASNGYFVRETDDKGYVVTGYLLDTLYGEQRAAFWTFKTDSAGNILWNYTQGGEDWGDFNGGNCVQQIMTKDYLALANFGLLKFNQAGDTLWTRNYAGGQRFQETTSSEFILTGAIGSSLFNEMITPSSNVWLFRVGNQGDSLWKLTYCQGVGYCVSQTPDKGFIATGMLQVGDLFLLKTDSLGLLGITENPIVETDNGWNVPHSIGSYVVLHYQGLPEGFRANVFDVTGRKVDQIRGDGNKGAMTWGINYLPGVYFIQAPCTRRNENGSNLKTVKVEIIR